MENEDIKELYDEDMDSEEVEDRTKQTVTIDKYILNIILKDPKSHCSISNNLILDNTGKSYRSDESKVEINGISAPMDFNVRGTYTDIYAQYSDVTVSIELTQKKTVVRNTDKCSDTPQGFKLSQIMETLGTLDKITNNTNQPNSLKNYGEILIHQDALRYSVGGRNFIIFKFTFTNIGNRIAQKIGFKDIFPSNIKVLKDKIFLDKVAIKENKAILKDNQLRVFIGNLSSAGTSTLHVVGEVIGCCDNPVNTGCVFYVRTSYYKRGSKKQEEEKEQELQKQSKDTNKTKIINVIQKLSNSKECQ